MTNPTFTLPIRVYYEDTDTGGVVYYANYLKFMERARTEWLRSFGVMQDELSRTQGVLFAVRSARLDYLKPARLDEQLDVSVELGRRGPASILLLQQVRREGEVLCRGEIKIACLKAPGFFPTAIPEDIVARINTWSLS
ncbi:MAG: tol-pal system-associated acyl-CoA thioesterase [Candidatus Muproteobacteria bacterium RBG_19FT_COMBO_61_10]|jgi:acyl-CoA thioester hydrolase|uniref:Tol-pal system-associated acyl-CoA thioesterase n=1 Tax=Candidatus Muproteobacteria bacterium RBG_19FT_COMBO_61_10 TaxID=1817761 RepID=A0A1F6UP19_9PROT|nr:MAG: tol-pal system-associated acyl-CoA thioesterase [Candidatus Muproteobacteria bacterium RBG_19FT_COMBO_61_10]